MRPSLKILTLAGILLSSGLGSDQLWTAGAQTESKPAISPRGGLLASGEGYRFEVFLYQTGVRVFPLDDAGRAIDTSRLTGTATFYHPNAPARPWFSRRLHPEPVATGETPTSLDLNIGLASAPQKGASVAFEITGLPGQAGSTAMFKVPLEFIAPAAAQPAAPGVSTVAEPRYIHGPGYYGYGYYAYPGPETVPQPVQTTPSYLSTPWTYGDSGSMSGYTVGPGHRDWTAGRDLPLAKPWLRPMD